MHQHEVPVNVGDVSVIRREHRVSAFGRRQGDVNVHDVSGNLPVVTGFVIVAAAFVVVANIIADLVYALLDPGVRIA